MGSIEERKRPLDFLKIAERFPDYEFVMIGAGSMQQLVSDEIEKRSLSNVTLTGRLDNADVIETLKKCSVLLITSEKEGLPKVVLEAASCGIPSIYINEKYSIDYIEDGKNGFAVQDNEQLIERLKLMIRSPEMYKSISKEAINLAKKYGWDHLIPQYEIYFSKTVKRFSGHS